MATMDSIRDQIPLQRYDTESPDDDDQEDVLRDQDLQSEQGTWERVTPDTRLGWAGAFVAGVLLAFGVDYFWPLIPPIFKSLEFVLAMFIPIAGLFGWLTGRQSGITYWSQFDHVRLTDGEHVRTVTGNIQTFEGKNPLIEELDSVGFAGLRTSYKRIDDYYNSDGTLMAKIDRREGPGEWGRARGLVDNVFVARGEHDFLGDIYVAHIGGTDETETAEAYEWRTEPPDTIDENSGRRLRQRYELFISDVFPSLTRRIEVLTQELEESRQRSLDDPLFDLSDIETLTEHFGGPRASNYRTDVAVPEPDYGDVDENVQQRLEEENDEN